MSWLEKLCEVYDNVIDTEDARGENPLVPVGFTQKTIKYNIILSADGNFIKAQEINRPSVVPSLPEAEGRTGGSKPFPLADGLKYLLADGEKENPCFEEYLKLLSQWCDSPGAPNCLRVLQAYLQKRTLYQDLLNCPEVTVKYHKDENARDGKGPDAKSVACFSVEDAFGQSELWMRQDVRESWEAYVAPRLGVKPEMCYVTGQTLPGMVLHPKLLGNAKLISAEDAGFPFQFRGRFVTERSAATVGALTSIKGHSALKWLLAHQGFQRYGVSIVGWNTKEPILCPADEDDPEQTEDRRLADTFEPYACALRDAALGYEEKLRRFTSGEGLTEEGRSRMNEVVILALESATPGRVSIVYEQEIFGNDYVARLKNWYDGCRWEMPGKEKTFRSPTWSEICQAVMGTDRVKIAKKDFRAEKSATKLMRENLMRLMACTVGGKPLPRDFVSSAFRQATQPLHFTDSKGAWQPFAWAQCVATACALIRKYQLDHRNEDASLGSGKKEWTPQLDMACRERSYLFGRLLAVAHKLELDATDGRTELTLAIRSLTRYVQRPAETWQKLYGQLTHSLKKLDGDGKSHSLARYYQRILGEIEQRFRPEDRLSTQALSEPFLIGYSAQTREMYLKQEEKQKGPEMEPYRPPQSRDELFGCLLAVADDCEWKAERLSPEEGFGSRRDGCTNAIQLTQAYMASPVKTWESVHEKMVPYLEKSGVRAAETAQRLLYKIEQRFDEKERLSNAPLGPGFLHGYLCMRLALTEAKGLDAEAWTPERNTDFEPASREAAFGKLLAIENRLERWVLDLEKTEEENRPSNAMRFLSRAAQRPAEVWGYLESRMRPYERSARRALGYPAGFVRQAEKLYEQIRSTEGWNADEPLEPGYLHYFYLYHAKWNERKDG